VDPTLRAGNRVSTVEVSLQGEIPESLLRAIEGAGVRVVPNAPIVLAHYAGAFSPDATNADALLALVSDPALAADALAAGAIDVVTGEVTAAELRVHFRRAARVAARFRRRIEENERRAPRAIQELGETRDVLERLIDATPNPVMATDPKGRVLVFNRVAESTLGYATQYAREHMHVTDVYATAGEARRVLSEIRGSAGRIVHGLEVRLRHRSGEHVPVLLSAGEVVGSDGQAIATIGVFQDLREQMSLKHRLQATTEQLIATEKRAATIELAGAAAHELNQPLTAVMGILELCELRTDLDEDLRKKLQRAHSQLARMAEIVKALARTSRSRTTAYVGAQRILELEADDSD
jgi:PAS domain S-box-containing protein